MTETVNFPPSYRKDRVQALHELWQAATHPDSYMTDEGFLEAIQKIEGHV